MGSLATKFPAFVGLVLGLGFVFTPLGCGSSPMGNARPASRDAGDGPSVPAATVAELRECAEHGAPRLTDTHYAIMFDVDVGEGGEVRAAKVRESMINDRKIVSCMEDALHGMSLPGVVTPLRSSGPVYGGSVSPEGRAPMGHPAAAAAGAAVNLVPIVLVAAGVTIVVAVTVHVISEASTRDATDEEKEKERCRKVLEMCIEKCTREAIPSGSLSGDPFFKCRRDCLEAENCWGVKLH